MSPIDVERVALWWGPGILVLIIFGYGFLRLAHYWIEKSMEVRRQQLESAYGLVRQYIQQFLGAQTSQADALSRLANCVEHRESLESFEHQEILIALKAMHRDIETLPCHSSDPPCVLTPSGLDAEAALSPSGQALRREGMTVGLGQANSLGRSSDTSVDKT